MEYKNNPLAIDDDGDGYSEFDGDCDDSEPLAFPGAAELDSETDCLYDGDGDGWGKINFIGVGTDCDDSNVLIHPGAAELDSELDCMADLDQDGFGDRNFENPGSDCDDSDVDSTQTTIDRDCDGTLTEADCDDYDENSTIIAEDGDCDGTITAADCDDNDRFSTIIAEDADCDGTLTIDDCDDYDEFSTIVAEDGDCDTVLTAEDCNDSDPFLLHEANDKDCDSVLNADDCDDNNPALLAQAEDEDCDGALTADDCDDLDDSLLAQANDQDCDDFDASTVNDMDCDGAFTADDCDDFDANSTIIATDGDCDGALTADDCDDSDASSTIVATDNDCDSVLTADDCDDNDVNSTIIAEDADCDGTITEEDCDDYDVNSTIIATDADCDGFTFIGCYNFYLSDGFGDGWNGNNLHIYEDQIHVETITLSSGSYAEETHCFDPDTQLAEIYFEDGNYNSEISFEILDNSGTLIGTGQGSGSNDLIFNNVTYSDGDLIHEVEGSAIFGCDDTDPYTYPGAAYHDSTEDCMRDADEDGYGDYLGPNPGTDCDDSDPNVIVFVDDVDCDGILSIDDCDDNDINFVSIFDDQDCDGFVTIDDCDDSNPLIYPNAPDLCDGVINDCNLSALDGDETDDDGDGYVECEIDASGWLGDSSVIGGLDCDDGDSSVSLPSFEGVEFSDPSASLTLSNAGFGIGQDYFTFEFWIQFPEVGTSGTLFRSTTDDDDWLEIFIDNSDPSNVSYSVIFGQEPNFCVFSTSFSYPRDAESHHIAFVKFGTEMHSFYDGALESSNSISWYGCNCGPATAPCLGESADAIFGGDGLSRIILGPTRFSKVVRYSPSSSFTPTSNWTVDGNTMAQYLTSGSFNGMLLEDVTGTNSATAVSGVSQGLMCPP